MKVLITGGIKSGKSYHGLIIANKLFNQKKYFLATAEPFDNEMEIRIKNHKKERQGSDFTTIEEPLYIFDKLENNSILDCVTMWINNIIYYDKIKDFDKMLEKLVKNLPENIVIITNETSLGNIPSDPVSRQYNNMLAKANREIAKVCDKVIMMVSGIPLFVKDEGNKL